MNKKELIKTVSELNNISFDEANKIVSSAFDTIKDELKNKGEVKIKEFGTFKYKESKERYGTNPQTQEKMFIPSKKTFGFKISKSLEEEMNK